MNRFRKSRYKSSFVKTSNYCILKGSGRKIAPGTKLIGPADLKDKLTVTIVLRRRPDAPSMPDSQYWATTPAVQRQYLTVEQLAATYGALQSDVDRVVEFAQSEGLIIKETHLGKRMVKVSGTVEQMNKAFRVRLNNYRTKGDAIYRGLEGVVSIPDYLTEIIIAVIGLDNRQIMKRSTVCSDIIGNDNTPVWMASMYNFPQGIFPKDQTIGILEFGGGFLQTDLNLYFSEQNLSTPLPIQVPVDGGYNNPQFTTAVELDYTEEVTLDICVAGAVAPGAKLVVYFAIDASMMSFNDAISAAIYDATNKPSVISISWYAGYDSELLESGTDSMTAIDMLFQDAHMAHINIFVASGDNGSTEGTLNTGPVVQFPASSPNITACGGTSISNVNGSSFTQSTWNNGTIGNEYQATGGGESVFFPVPAWQTEIGAEITSKGNNVSTPLTGRGIPDIAGDADGYSEYGAYYLYIDGIYTPGFGGTSMVAPLYAGLIALANSFFGTRIGFLNPTLYALNKTLLANANASTVFTEINDGGNNGAYKSGPGWNACTGLGSVNGGALFSPYETNKIPLNETSQYPPAICKFYGIVYIAWTDENKHLNIMTSVDGITFGRKRTFNYTSILGGPALAVFGNRLYIAWTSATPSHSLMLMFLEQGLYSSTPMSAPTDVTSFTAPSITSFRGKLYLAWVGNDSAHSLNIISFDGTSFGTKKILTETSIGTPNIYSLNGVLYMVWTGTDSCQSLNIKTSIDGINFYNKITYDQTSGSAPCISSNGTFIFIGWTGTDNLSINFMTTKPQALGERLKVTLKETADGAPALSYPYFAWTDENHNIQVAKLVSVFF